MGHEHSQEAGKAYHNFAVSDLGSDFVIDPNSEPISRVDLDTLRRVSDKIPWKAYTIGFTELVERLSYYGAVQVCFHTLRSRPV